MKCKKRRKMIAKCVSNFMIECFDEQLWVIFKSLHNFYLKHDWYCLFELRNSRSVIWIKIVDQKLLRRRCALILCYINLLKNLQQQKNWHSQIKIWLTRPYTWIECVLKLCTIYVHCTLCHEQVSFFYWAVTHSIWFILKHCFVLVCIYQAYMICVIHMTFRKFMAMPMYANTIFCLCVCVCIVS